MTTKYTREGDILMPLSPTIQSVTEGLPPDYYTVGLTPKQEFFFARIGAFRIPDRIYGHLAETADRIMTTFHARDESTGVLLVGDRGSGKTLLAKILCDRAIKLGLPVVAINQPYAGPAFNSLIQNIQSSSVILLDEFEKTYSKDKMEDEEDNDRIGGSTVKAQHGLLTLLDGVYTMKRLFILTCNDLWRLERNLLNRPGRLWYRYDFTGMDTDGIREYVKENLKNKAHAASLLKITSAFSSFTFDMLRAVVEEMNRFDEPALEAMRVLNVRIKDDFDRTYEGVLVRLSDEKEINKFTLEGVSPLRRANFAVPLSDEDKRGFNGKYTFFDQRHLVGIDPNDEGAMTYENDTHRAIIRRQREKVYGAFSGGMWSA